MDETPWLLGGRYRLDERIGAGGMGEVWRATDQVLGRTVAVKLMIPALVTAPDFERRFLFEARAMASLNHPGVVAIHDYRTDERGTYLVMEYVAGESLSATLRRLGRLSATDTMNLVAQAADALAAAHARGIVHRDVKPGNLLIRTDGTVVLSDFGIARAASETPLTTTGQVLGTPSYLAPEQVLGKPATPLSDIYALGVVAYECVAGRRPFDADNPFGVAMMRLRDLPPALGPEVPPAVARVVGGALARDPRSRWQAAADLAAAARSAAGRSDGGRSADGRSDDGAHPVIRAVPGPGSPNGRPLTRRWLAITAAVLVALSLFAAGIWATATGALHREDRGAATPTGDRGAATPSANARATSGGLPADVAPDFVGCGDAWCPVRPMCWDGLVVIGGRAQPLSPRDCAQPHYWETYAVAPMPADALDVGQDELLETRPDVAAICSASRMAAQSRDPAMTVGYAREPWPVQLGDGGFALYCLGGATTGEMTGSVFRTGT